MKMLRTMLAVSIIASASTSALASVSEADKAFLQQEAQGARYEIALAKLAAAKATKAPIRAYARKIVADHSRANPALNKLAHAKGVSTPAMMNQEDQAKLVRLQGLSGSAFDQAYVDEVTRINAEDKASLAKESDATQDREIKAYLARFSQMDAAHERMGSALKGQ